VAPHIFSINIKFLGTFAKWQKVTVSFVMCVRPHGTTRLALDAVS